MATEKPRTYFDMPAKSSIQKNNANRLNIKFLDTTVNYLIQLKKFQNIKGQGKDFFVMRPLLVQQSFPMMASNLFLGNKTFCY